MSDAKRFRTMGAPTPNENTDILPQDTRLVASVETVRRGTKQTQKILRITMKTRSLMDPRLGLSWFVRRALWAGKHKTPDCIVYDAAGNKIAIMDGKTGERRDA